MEKMSTRPVDVTAVNGYVTIPEKTMRERDEQAASVSILLNELQNATNEIKEIQPVSRFYGSRMC